MALSQNTTTGYKQPQQSFHMRKVDNIRLGVSSIGDLLIAFVDFFDKTEKNAEKGNSFNKIVMSDLSRQCKVLNKFFDYVSGLFDSNSEFTYFITNRPQRYNDIPPHNVRLCEVKIQRLAHTFVNRLHYAGCNLFESGKPENWDPSRVTMRGKSYAELTSFATEFKRYWDIFDDGFADSFGRAIAHAVEISKTEQDERRKTSLKKEGQESGNNETNHVVKLERQKLLKGLFEQEVERQKRQNRGKKNFVLNEDEIWESSRRRLRVKERKEREKLAKQIPEPSKSNDTSHNVHQIVIESQLPSENLWNKGNPLTEKSTVHQERLIKEIRDWYNPKLEKTVRSFAQKDDNEVLIDRFLESDKSLTPIELEIVKEIVYQSKVETDSRSQKKSEEKSEKKSTKRHSRNSKNKKKVNLPYKVDKIEKVEEVDLPYKVDIVASDDSDEWHCVGERKRTPKKQDYHQQRKNKQRSRS